MWPLLILGGAYALLARRPRRNPDWYTDAQGRHHPIRHGASQLALDIPYDPVKGGDSATPRASRMAKVEQPKVEPSETLTDGMRKAVESARNADDLWRKSRSSSKLEYIHSLRNAFIALKVQYENLLGKDLDSDNAKLFEELNQIYQRAISVVRAQQFRDSLAEMAEKSKTEAAVLPPPKVPTDPLRKIIIDMPKTVDPEFADQLRTAIIERTSAAPNVATVAEVGSEGDDENLEKYREFGRKAKEISEAARLVKSKYKKSGVSKLEYLRRLSVEFGTLLVVYNKFISQFTTLPRKINIERTIRGWNFYAMAHEVADAYHREQLSLQIDEDSKDILESNRKLPENLRANMRYTVARNLAWFDAILVQIKRIIKDASNADSVWQYRSQSKLGYLENALIEFNAFGNKLVYIASSVKGSYPENDPVYLDLQRSITSVSEQGVLLRKLRNDEIQKAKA